MLVSGAGSLTPSTGGYDIDNSLRFNDDDSAYLSRLETSAGDRKTWTWSGWVKRGNTGTGQSLFGAVYSGAQNYALTFQFGSSDQLMLTTWAGPQLKSDALFRDASAWYHIVLRYDTTQATESDRVRMYVNGERISLVEQSYGDWYGYPSQNDATRAINGGYATITMSTRNPYGNDNKFDGLLSEVHFVDGTSLDPTSFGEFGDYGEWKPIEVSGLTYGTNGFYLPFSGTSSSAIVDSSGSGHSITLNGNTTHSSTKSKIGATSIYLDGTGDNLQMSDNGDWQLGTADFTLEGWFNFSSLSSGTYALFSQHNNDNSHWKVYLEGGAGNNIRLYYNQVAIVATTSAGLSTNTWHHIAVVRDSTGDKIYVDGTQVGSGTSKPEIGDISANLTIGSGEESGGVGYTVQGYLDEIRISTGIARYTSSFTPSTTAFVNDSYTKLLIHSDYVESNSLGGDNSPNNNHWTTNSLASTDQMLDTPTNNFCTLNPLDPQGTNSTTFSEGNLKIVQAASWTGSVNNFLMTSGKWYWEDCGVDMSNSGAGVIKPFSAMYNGMDVPNNGYFGAGDRGYGINFQHGTAGTFYTNTTSTTSSYLSAYSDGDVVSVAYDADTGKIWIAKNGTWGTTSGGLGNPSSGANPAATVANPEEGYYAGFVLENCTIVANFGQDSSFAGNKTAQGKQDSNDIGDFYYTPPTGFLSLCTKNLPDPAVIPSEHFNTLTYSGNSTDGRSVTGVGFAPDLVWSKARSSGYTGSIYDKVRGAGASKHLTTSETEAEGTGNWVYGHISSFDSDGYSLGVGTDGGNPYANENESGTTYVAWNWKAGGTGVSNTSGSITSTVSANADAGFSIVSYTAGDGDELIGHGLSKSPELIIVKRRNTSGNWVVHCTDISTTNKQLYLNTTAAVDTNNISSIGASTFRVSGWSDVTVSGGTYIAYCFHSVDGYSKVGSYTGNGSSDGTFVYTGFRPAYVLIKRSNSSGQGAPIFDSARDEYNMTVKRLNSNASNSELTTDGNIDFLSNGFKARNTDGSVNSSGGEYIFLCFAESPFKHTNAR
jgi:hypothetical protein